MKPLFSIALLALSSLPQTLPSWNVAIDSRTTSQWLAESPGFVYAAKDRRIVAIDTERGSISWRSSIQPIGAPAYVRGALAVPTRSGVALLDASNGRIISTHALSGSIAIARGETRFVAVQSRSDVPNIAIGLDTNGRIAWQRRLESSAETIATTLGGDAVGLLRGSTLLVLDARTGNAVAQATYVDDIVGADGRYLWFTVVNGGIKGLDLDTNRSIAVHGHIIPKAVSVEHAIAVAVVDGRLHTIDLRSGDDRPLHIYGRWIGGPIAGKILVERADGLYVQPLAERGRAVRVARYTAESRIVTSDRNIAYVGLLDGTIFAIDMQKPRALQRVATGCRFYEGFTTSGATAIVHCDDDTAHSRLVAFSRALVTASR